MEPECRRYSGAQRTALREFSLLLKQQKELLQWTCTDRDGHEELLAGLQDEEPLALSPFDVLSHVRISPFGAWCFGESEKKPELQRPDYEAIADRDLLVITFKGEALECKLFLEEVGARLGEERYRISADSFIRGCRSLPDIEGRIERFYRLIDPEPPVRWQRLFNTLRTQAVLFENAEECSLFSLPDDPALRRLFYQRQEACRPDHSSRGRAYRRHSRQLQAFSKDHRILRFS